MSGMTAREQRVAPDALRHEPRGHLLRYGGWQFRDYVLEKGIGTLLVAVLSGYLSLMGVRGVLAQGRAMTPELYGMVLSQLVSNLVFVGALFATNGIVSDDRKNGFYRFYFAKPVSLTGFYLQKYLLAFAGFLLVALLLVPGWMHFFAQPAPHPALLLAIAAGFVLYTGVGFLVSAFVRTDWLSFIAIYLAAKVAWMNWGDRDGLVGALVHALPPMGDQLGQVESQAITGVIEWKLVAWAVGYGVACLLLGLLALRKRPLGSG